MMTNLILTHFILYHSGIRWQVSMGESSLAVYRMLPKSPIISPWWIVFIIIASVWRMAVTTQALELKLPPPLLPGCRLPTTPRCLILTLSWTKTPRRNWIHNQTHFQPSSGGRRCHGRAGDKKRYNHHHQDSLPSPSLPFLTFQLTTKKIILPVRWPVSYMYLYIILVQCYCIEKLQSTLYFTDYYKTTTQWIWHFSATAEASLSLFLV